MARRALVIGDSLTVGDAPYLRARGGVRVDARVGRPSSEAVGVLRQRLRPGHQAVVFDVGTNDASWHDLRHSVRAAGRIARGRPLIMATVRGPDAANKNAYLRRARDRGEIKLVPWLKQSRTPGFSAGDGIHATPAGYRARGALLSSALKVPGGGVAIAASRHQELTTAHAADQHARSRGGTPGTKHLPQSVYNAINRAVTPKFARWARKTYGIGGKRLLALVAAGEGGGSIDEGTSNTSSAGARGPFQFIPDTRSGYIKQYGIDAWKSDYDAARAAIIHLMGTGVAGYNPGMPTYTQYILGQSVDTRPLVTGRLGGKAAAGGGGGAVSQPYITRGAALPGSTGLVGVLQALRAKEQRPQIQSSQLQAPFFSAGAAMPKGYQAPPSGGGPAPKDNTFDQMLQAVSTLQGAAPPQSVVHPGSVSGGGQGGGGGGSAGGGLSAKADGWYGTKSLAQTGKKIAADAGIAVTSEKRDRKFTSSGNISDHWTGNKSAWADDYGAPGTDSGQGIKLARDIAKAYGVKFAMNSYASGGTVRVDGKLFRIQILYGSGVGHGDHVHVGIKRVL